MDAAAREFRDLVHNEVAEIYRKGFRLPVEPKRLPALTELSAALCPDGTSYDEAVENTLHRAIAAAAAPLLSAVEAQREVDVRKGLTTLLGMSENADNTLEIRRDEAGPDLGYPKGDERLRKAEHKKRLVVNWIVNELHTQLIQMAEAVEFSYEGRFFVGNPPKKGVSKGERGPPTDEADEIEQAIKEVNVYVETAPPLTARQEQMLELFSSLFFGDLVEIIRCGFEIVCNSAYRIAPHVSSLAYICVGGYQPQLFDDSMDGRVQWVTGHPGRVSANELEVLLRWVARQVNDARAERGVIELFGLGEARGLEWKDRQERALKHMSVDSHHDHHGIVKLLAECLAQLAVRSEYESLFGVNSRKRVESLPFAFGQAGQDDRFSR